MGATIEGHAGVTGGRWFGRGVLRVLIVAGLLGFCPAGPRAETVEKGSLREEMEALDGYRGPDRCQKEWEILWRHVQKNDPRAAAGIWFSTAFGHFTPPMEFSSDAQSLRVIANFIILSIPVTEHDGDFADFDSFSSIRSESIGLIWPETDPDRKRCVANAPPLDCVDIAFERGFAATMAEVSAAVEEGKRNGLRASCFEDRSPPVGPISDLP